MKKSHRDPATINLRMIKHRQETDGCPSRECCVELWGDEETFCSIRDLTKFELMYKQDEFIYKMGDPVTSLYVIQSGAIKLEKEVEGGGKHVSGFYFTGDLFGLESVYLEQYHYNAIALKDTWVCEVRLKKLSTLGKSAAAIQHRMNTLLSRKLREIDEHLYSTRHLQTEPRLLDFLNVLCKKNLDYVDDDLNRFVLPMVKADIANYLGMRPESLSRAFRQLEAQGIVKNGQKSKSTVFNKQKILSEVMKKSA
jgi:CRP/FNR family transcriptional regulator